MKTKVPISRTQLGAFCRFGDLDIRDHFLYDNKLYVKTFTTQLTIQFANCISVKSGTPSFIASETIVEAIDASFAICGKESPSED